MAYDFSHFRNDDENVADFMVNNLILIDASVETLGLNYKPQFHLLGGTALVFHGMKYTSTLDIDTANTIEKDVKKAVGAYISDNASEVATLAPGYEQRLVAFKPEIFKYIEVYLLSLEDLVISKLACGRTKDLEDVSVANALNHCNMDVLETLSQKLDKESAARYRRGLKMCSLR